MFPWKQEDPAKLKMGKGTHENVLSIQNLQGGEKRIAPKT